MIGEFRKVCPQSTLQWFAYFARSVLEHYRSQSHLYSLTEDSIGGSVGTRTIVAGEVATGHQPYWRVRFAFRRLQDGSRAVAAFRPDLSILPSNEGQRWSSDSLKCPAFAQSDPEFDRWCERHLRGSWSITDGPGITICEHIQQINAITRHVLGRPFFKSESHPFLWYPVAQNTKAYTEAIVALHQLVVDGICKRGLTDLACKLGVSLTCPSKTLNSLKELLPSHLHCVVHAPLAKVRDERAHVHGVPEDPPQSMDAFTTFRGLLCEAERALGELKAWLESALSVQAQACVDREKAMAAFPRIVGPPDPPWKWGSLADAVGKTIKDVEFGLQQTGKDVGSSEALILSFTDDSAMALTIGSNAGALADRHDSLAASDFSTDIMVHWLMPVPRKPLDSNEGHE